MQALCRSDWEPLEKTFRIALGDIAGNICPYKGPVQEKENTVFLAGLAYDRPWTRDAAINGWNGGTLVFPEISRNTLLSSLVEDEHGLRIGGQYWDAVIWACGAWDYYQATGERKFLRTAKTAVVNSLAYFESTEFNPGTGLFRGGGCYADGISAYGPRYANTRPYHDIHFWPEMNPAERAEAGVGVPLQSLSTNCLYYQGYRLAVAMGGVLGERADRRLEEAAEALKEAINRNLWNEEEGRYDYYIDPWEIQGGQEGLGVSFALLFGVADGEKRKRLIEGIHITPHGIPCLWPSFPRYNREGHYGRHSGTVWPMIQGFWGEAALREGREDLFFKELDSLIGFAVRDGQFGEVFHPDTGAEYGGLQENPEGKIEEYFLCHRQTWSATAFLRLLFRGVAGISYTPEEICLAPVLPPGCTRLILEGLRLGEQVLNLKIRGKGRKATLRVNGIPMEGGGSPDPWGPFWMWKSDWKTDKMINVTIG